MASNIALRVIDGEDVPAVGRDWFETCDPASGEVLARVPRAAAADVDAAVRAAREAQPGWQALSPRERGTMLLAIADLIADRAEELTRLETLDVGKPLHEARVDVHHAERLFRFYGEVAGGLDQGHRPGLPSREPDPRRPGSHQQLGDRVWRGALVRRDTSERIRPREGPASPH
jgi:acyl-CoA reductase-like NAD-dependent aldehyde dehydrogenase